MSLGVGIVGYGSVAAVHARRLSRLPEARLLAVCGPDLDRARRFAGTHQIPHATRELDTLLELVEAVVIASPSPVHSEQTRCCLQAGRHTLVELPPCRDSQEARELKRAAGDRVLGCAHTSRFLAPYRKVRAWIREGRLGEIEQVNYLRVLEPRRRSWQDNAFFHHAAHPVDLLLEWFGEIHPQACLLRPSLAEAREAALLACLPGQVPALVSVSYHGAYPVSRMLVVGRCHSVETDGFSWLRSDLPELDWQGDPQQEYEEAIAQQDRAFLQACLGGEEGVGWEETERLLRTLEGFAARQGPEPPAAPDRNAPGSLPSSAPAPSRGKKA